LSEIVHIEKKQKWRVNDKFWRCFLALYVSCILIHFKDEKDFGNDIIALFFILFSILTLMFDTKEIISLYTK